MEILKVAAGSKANAVAGALAGCIREHGKAELHACGAGAVNVAVKAIAIARGFCAPQGFDLIAIPAFKDQMFGDEERTIIRLIVEPR